MSGNHIRDLYRHIMFVMSSLDAEQKEECLQMICDTLGLQTCDEPSDDDSDSDTEPELREERPIKKPKL